MGCELALCWGCPPVGDGMHNPSFLALLAFGQRVLAACCVVGLWHLVLCGEAEASSHQLCSLPVALNSKDSYL